MLNLPNDRWAGLAVTAGDLDGDGDSDLIFGHLLAQARIYINHEGRFLRRTGIPFSTDNARAIACGDVDGDLDLVIGSFSRFDALLINNGTGQFTVAQGAFTGSPPLSVAIQLEDVDSDGDLDLASVNFGTGVRLWLNDGSGGFGTPTTISAQTVVTDATFGDVDGDGDPDLIMATYGSEEVHTNDGAGNFAYVPFAMPAIQSIPDSIATADLDRDGDLDVVTGGPVNHVYINDGSGFFREESSRWLSSAAESVSRVHLADVDDDGRPDILGTTPESLLVHTNAGGRFGRGQQLGADTGGGIASSIDVDGDGNLEILVATGGAVSHRLFGTSRSRIFEQTGDSASPELLPRQSFESSAVADFDGNGLQDLAGSLSGTAAYALWLQDAGGLQRVPDGIPAVKKFVTESVAADLDGDAAPDLVLIDNGRRVVLMINDGNASFSDQSTRLGTVAANAVAAGDLDGDGIADLLVDIPFGTVTAYLQRVGGFVQGSSIIGSRPGLASSLEDLDGDGDLDFMSSSPLRVQLNQGDATFLEGQFLSQSNLLLDAGDIDGDGDVDWIGTDPNTSGRTHLWTNDGAGNFTEVSAKRLPPSAYGFGKMVLTDLDDDGDLDLWAAISIDGSTPDSWFRNDGRGYFTPAATGPIIGGVLSTAFVAAVDLDGDDDTDVLTYRAGIRQSSQPPNGLFPLRNLHRQLEIPLSPQPGGTLQIDAYAVDGRSGGLRAAFPFVDTFSSPAVRLGSLGLWHLSTRALPLPPIPLVPSSGTVRYALPTLPSLAWVDLHVQALFVPSSDPATWHLSNLVRRVMQ